MLKLFILRHGKAVRPEPMLDDFDRKLNKKGITQVNQIGFFLEKENIQIEQIIASSARRTEETAEIMNFFMFSSEVTYDRDLYLTSAENIQKILCKLANKKTVLLVGHNFGLSDFVNDLVGDNLTLSTSMLAEISFNFDDWNEIGAGKGKLERIIEPRVNLL